MKRKPKVDIPSQVLTSALPRYLQRIEQGFGSCTESGTRSKTFLLVSHGPGVMNSCEIRFAQALNFACRVNEKNGFLVGFFYHARNRASSTLSL